MRTFIFQSAFYTVCMVLLLSGIGGAEYTSFNPETVWLDNNGVHINAHGGGILDHDGVYYWFGEHKVKGPKGNAAQVGVSCYSSTDLYNWKDEGIALSVSDDPESDIVRGCILERPKVIYNSKTGKFVLWFHLELKGQGYDAARAGVAVSDKAAGPYTYIRSVRPNAGHWPVNVTDEQKDPESIARTKAQNDNFSGGPTQKHARYNILGAHYESGQMSRDMTLFVDDDGRAYHLYSSEHNSTLHIALLTDDYTDHTGRYVRVFPNRWMEAPAICKRDGKYYLIASGCTGWKPNAARSAVADSIWGPWKELGNPCEGVNPHNNLGPEKTFGGQSTFILPVRDKKDAFIAMFDVWTPDNPIDGRYIWLPVEFIDDSITARWHDEWDLNVFDASQQVCDMKKPNIVLIYIDDMGWKDAGYMGSDLYQTPNIDQLSKEGMVFTNAYAAAGNCAPSRACLISGQYTPRHGIYAVNRTDRGPKNLMRLRPVPNTRSLAPENVTIGEALKAAGYATGMFGKWHLGYDDAVRPAAQGFDISEDSRPPSSKEFKEDNDPKDIYEITEGACRFIEANQDRPFFVYISHHATHMQIQARKEMYEKFKQLPEGKQHKHKEFAAMNCQMDDGVGIVLDTLKTLGLEDDTLVVFTSDNGALPQSSPAPLRGHKGMYYEGGIRVPMIVRWPGIIKPGTTCDAPVINVDFYPTFLAAAGGGVPSGKVLDGVDISPLLKGQSYFQRSIFWHFPGYLDDNTGGSRSPNFRSRPVSVIRKGDWKLHLYHEEWVLDGGREKIETNNSVELYHLKDDISEGSNLANTNPAKRDELLNDLLRWIKDINAPVPGEKNPGYNPTAKQK